MHLSIAKRSLCKHVLSDPANLRRSRYGDLPALFVLAVSKKLVPINKDPKMASQVLLVRAPAASRCDILVGKV